MVGLDVPDDSDDIPDDSLEVTIRHEGNVTIIEIRGSMTRFADTKITEAHMNATEAGAKQVVLDFHHCHYINSADIAILIMIVTSCGRNGQKLAMSGLNDHFQKIFRMVGLSQYT
jgi:anti-anti-sigma factor